MRKNKSFEDIALLPEHMEVAIVNACLDGKMTFEEGINRRRRLLPRYGIDPMRPSKCGQCRGSGLITKFRDGIKEQTGCAACDGSGRIST